MKPKYFIDTRLTLRQLIEFIDYNCSGGEYLAIHSDNTEKVDIVETSSKLLEPFYDKKLDSMSIYEDKDDTYEIWFLDEESE